MPQHRPRVATIVLVEASGTVIGRRSAGTTGSRTRDPAQRSKRKRVTSVGKLVHPNARLGRIANGPGPR